MQRGRSVKRRIMAWVLSLVMVASVIMVPAGKVEAAAVEVNLNPVTTAVTATANGEGNVEIRFDIPSEYNTTEKLATAGIKRLQVKFKVTDYTAAAGKDAGAQAFFNYGTKWESTGSWVNLSKGTELTSTLNITSYITGSDQVNGYGIQFANISGSITYQIISAKLIGSTSEGGDSSDPASVGETSANVTATITESKVAGTYHEYYLKVDNKLGSAINDWLVAIPITGIESAQDWTSWAKVKISYTSSYLYLTPLASSDGTINAGGSFGSTTEGAYKFNYTASSNVTTPVVYYSTSSGAFEDIISEATSASGSSGGGSSGGGDAVSGTGALATDTTTDQYPDDEYNFAKLLQYSLYFYDANMCGDVEGISEAEWRKNCHAADKIATYNGKTVDVSGGFHDAGDHDKFALTEGYAASILGMGYYEFKEAYSETGQTSHYKKILDYFCDSFLRRTVLDNDGNAIAFCYQVGDGTDHGSWVAADSENIDRPVYFADSANPATEQISEPVAAMAIHYVNFGDEKYLEGAEKLFKLAKNSSKKSVGNLGHNAREGETFYGAYGYADDYCLAAIWLYKATGKAEYIEEYQKYCGEMSQSVLQSWAQVGAFAAGYYNYFYDKEASNAPLAANATSQINKNTITSDGGFLWLNEWGSARYNCNVQLGGLISDKESGKNQYGAWATGQMKYLLGNNGNHRCYVTWYNNTTASQHPHHRTACDFHDGWDSFNANAAQNHKLLGALVGGPFNTSGYYEDTVKDAKFNEVAIDYNAAFTGAAAALYLLNKKDGKQMLDSDYLVDDSATCGQNKGGDPTKAAENVSGITLSQTKLSIDKGAEKTLSATTTPDDTVITWTSDKESVATVDSTGKVTAVSKGTAVITATTAEGKKATCTVTVTVPLTGLKLKKDGSFINDCSMEKGEVVTISDTGSPDIKVVPVPADADYDEITLSSDKPAIVSVDNTTHEIKALSKGNANITVASGEITCIYAVSVTVTPGSIELDENELSLTTKSGENTYTLTATVGPEDATYETSNISWSVDNIEVITIERDENNPAKAVVTAAGNGSAVVTVSLSVPGIAEPIKASCNVTVSTPVDSIDIEQEPVTLLTTEGKNTAQLTAGITPSDATDVKITWISSDTKVATVDKNGKVTAVGKGEAVITAKVGKQEDTCTVTVVKPITAIAITDGKGNEITTRTMAKRTSETMSVEVTPSDATDADKIVWSLKSGDGIVSVDAGTGEVTALAKGTAEVQVTVGEEVSGINNIKTAAYTITVSNIITAVSLKDKNDKTESSVEKGTELVLTAAFTPDDEDVDEPGITWESSAPELVSVTPDESKKSATVKAISPTDGEAVTITLTVKPAADADPIVKEYKLTVTREAQEAPVISEIKVLERTTDSIAVSVAPVQEDKTYEYSVDGGKSWVDFSKITKLSDTTYKITGLSEATGYNVVVRFAGDTDHEPSPAGKTSDGKTAAAKTGTLIAVTDPYIINVGRLPGGTGYNDADELKDAYVNALYISDDGTDNGRVASAEYDNGRLTLYPGRNYKLVGSNDKLIISYKEDEPSSEASEDKSTITLDNATIKNVDVKATVKVAGNTTVEGDIKADNVEVSDTAEAINVKGDVNADNVNVAAGTGTVKVAGKISADNVEISSGTVTVDEGIKASSDVTITGGTVAATGDKDTAAIEADKINISSGTVNATGTNGGAAIKGDTVTVKGGDVTATGKDEGSAAITGSTVELSGGTISATGGAGASAVEAAETITIGSSVKLSVNTSKKSDGTVASAISSKAITIEENAEIKADENAKADLFNVTPTDANGVAVDITKYTGKTEELVVPQPKDDKGKTETTTPAGQGSTEAQTPQPVKATDMTVTANVKGVTSASLSGTYQLALKKSLTVAVSFSPENAVSETITVTSSNPKVVAVNGTKLTAKKVGTAKITVISENGLTKTFSVKVMKKAVSKIKLKAAKKTVKAGKTLKLKATITPSKKKAGNKLYWSSSDDSIATVTDKGVVKGVKKGKVKITATALDGSGKKATVKITVK